MAMREAGPGDARHVSLRPSPPGFVGREAELAALGAALDGGPAVVLIEGEAGIGKSRLVGEYLASAAGHRQRSLVATCPHFREPYTLAPIVEAVRQATDRVADLPLSDLAGALRPLFPEWADELPAAPEPLGDVRASRHRLFRALLELLDNLGLAVLVVEDVHWADDATLELLLFLVARQPPPLSLVVTYRPEDVPVGSLLLRLSSRLPSTTTRLRLPVGPLDVSQTAQLVSSMLDESRHPATAKAVGQGAMYALAPGKGLLAHRERGGTLHNYVFITEPQSWFAAIDFTDAAAAAARIAQEFDDWAPELTALITHSDTSPVLRPLYTLPTEHRWDRMPGVTLLGDAAHLTAPNGEGANLAMYDGSELAKAIAAHPDDVEAAITEYEQAMFPRSTEAAAEGTEGHELLFGEGTPYVLLGVGMDDDQTS